MADVDTILTLGGIGVAPYSARGLTQTLTPIQQSAVLHRTIDGGLEDFSFEGFRKYASAISCADQRPPSVDGVWGGKIVTVDCVAELSYPVGGEPQRTPVSGSERTEEGFVFYRPQLEMKVISFSLSQDEYAATVNWSMQLEEI